MSIQLDSRQNLKELNLLSFLQASTRLDPHCTTLENRRQPQQQLPTNITFKFEIKFEIWLANVLILNHALLNSKSNRWHCQGDVMVFYLESQDQSPSQSACFSLPCAAATRPHPPHGGPTSKASANPSRSVSLTPLPAPLLTSRVHTGARAPLQAQHSFPPLSTSITQYGQDCHI